jgi:hypothetical protein
MCPFRLLALREISRMPAAAATEDCNQCEKRRMFRPSIPLIAVVAAAPLPEGFAVSFQAGSRDDAGRHDADRELGCRAIVRAVERDGR